MSARWSHRLLGLLLRTYPRECRERFGPASRGEVLGLIVRQGRMLAAAGLVIGLAGSIAASQLLRSLLFETDIDDPLTFAIVPVLLAEVSLAACYLPARRAAVVDPMVTLRTD